MTPPGTTILHASCVALERRAVLITGVSGTGKSALALHLAALGAVLVADDRTQLSANDDVLTASAPPAIRGMIEARGVGLLRAETIAHVPVVLAVDLGRVETERLPPERHAEILRCRIPLLHKVEHAHFPAAILQYLKGGRCA